jgi:transcriptional regulator with XRE-family HTH domain
MDRMRVARSFRALRIHRGLRQADVGAAAGLSRSLVSKVERGELDGVTIRVLDRLVQELGASLDVRLQWRAEGLDRLLDASHAGLVDSVVSLLHRAGWDTAVEVTFNEFGERGSVDVMGLRRDIGAVLITEVKSVVPDAGGMLSTLDRKERLAPVICRRLAWPCRSVSTILVIGESSTTRRRVADLGALRESAFPMRGRAVRTWVASPTGSIAGLLFLPYATTRGPRRGISGCQRVRRATNGRTRR